MLDFIVSVILLVATLVLAGGAVWSVIVSKSTADNVKRNTKIQAILQVLDEFRSVEMGGYLTKLYVAFKGDKRRKETIDGFKILWKNGDRSRIKEEVDEARRYVAWYFTKVFLLWKNDVLTENDIKENYLVKDETIKDILLDKVEQIDRPDRGKDMYDFFRCLYPDRNEK